MSNAHKGSKLILQDAIIPVEFSTAHLDFNKDETGIEYGQLIEPVSGVYTMRLYEGKFGGSVAIEEGTTNNLVSPDDPTKWTHNKQTAWGFVSDRFVDTIFGTKGYERTVTGNDYRGTMSTISYATTPTNMTVPYTFSIYARCIDNYSKAQVTLDFEGADSGSVRKDIQSTYLFTNNDWQRFVLSGTPSSVSMASMVSTMKIYAQSRDNSTPVTVQLTMPQMEQKSFATSFANGTRAHGRILYPSTVINKSTGTISCWIKLNSASINAWQRIISFVGSATVNGQTDLNFDLSTTNNVRLKVDSTNYAMSTGTIDTANKWYHVACSWGSDGIKVYINGSLDKTVSYTGGVGALEPNISIGERQSDSTNPFNGLISDMAMFKTQLTDEDILAIYVSNRPLYNPFDKRAYAL